MDQHQGPPGPRNHGANPLSSPHPELRTSAEKERDVRPQACAQRRQVQGRRQEVGQTDQHRCGVGRASTESSADRNPLVKSDRDRASTDGRSGSIRSEIRFRCSHGEVLLWRPQALDASRFLRRRKSRFELNAGCAARGAHSKVHAIRELDCLQQGKDLVISIRAAKEDLEPQVDLRRCEDGESPLAGLPAPRARLRHRTDRISNTATPQTRTLTNVGTSVSKTSEGDPPR